MSNNNKLYYRCNHCGNVLTTPSSKHLKTHKCRLTDASYAYRHHLLANITNSMIMNYGLSYNFTPQTNINRMYERIHHDFNFRKHQISVIDKKTDGLTKILPYDVVEYIKKYLYDEIPYYYRTIHSNDPIDDIFNLDTEFNYEMEAQKQISR